MRITRFVPKNGIDLNEEKSGVLEFIRLNKNAKQDETWNEEISRQLLNSS
jgi:hypothetical protein